MTDKHTEALEKLNRGIQESRQEVQKRTMNLAQGYFDDSAEVLKQHIKENRATLKDLPDQIPGGREEAFQELFQELMDSYSAMEDSIDGARENVANLDIDRIRRQGEVEATDAARRQAKELGVDLTKVEGSGADGRIIVPDVVEAAERMEDEAGGDEEPDASENGAAEQAQEAAGQATDQVGEVAGQAQEAAGGAAQQAQDTAGQAAGQAQEVAGQATDQAGQAVQGVQDTAGQATDQAQEAARQVQETVGGLVGGGQEDGGGPLGGGVTDQAGQVAGQAQQVAGQATDQAGQVAGQAQDAAGGATQQAQETVGYAAENAQNAAGQTTGGGEAEEPRATNAARRRAKELGVDLSTIEGTGSGGLITIQDVVGS
ncbi:MAG TPA: E3 binding domain-containing protein [Thermoanaerobaculia bacterium]